MEKYVIAQDRDRWKKELICVAVMDLNDLWKTEEEEDNRVIDPILSISATVDLDGNDCIN